MVNNLYKAREICPAMESDIFPSRYFVGQKYGGSGDNFFSAIESALSKLGLQPLRADKNNSGDFLICKVMEYITRTDLGVYYIDTDLNRNVFIELGISIGFGKKIVLIEDSNVNKPHLVNRLKGFQAKNFNKIVNSFSQKIDQYTTIVDTEPPSSDLEIKPGTIFIAHGELEPLDISASLIEIMNSNNLECVVLGNEIAHFIGLKSEQNFQYTYVNTIPDVIAAIRASRLCVFRADSTASADSFLALGFAFALKKPIVLIFNSRDRKKLPVNLTGIDRLEFDGYVDLKEKIEANMSYYLQETINAY